MHWLISIILLLLASQAWGFHQPIADHGNLVTQEEIDVWDTRCDSGPYDTAGDVSTNSPGDCARIESNVTTFASGPSSGRWVGGFTLSGTCVDGVSSNEPSSSEKAWATRLRDAAWWDMVQGITIHHAAIITELTTIAADSEFDFSDTALWCDDTLFDANPIFVITENLNKIFHAYVYTGRSAFSAGQLSTLDTWFWNMADWLLWEPDHGLDSLYVDRGTNYTRTQSCASAVLPWVGGPSIFNYAKNYNNRRSQMYALSAAIAVYLDETGFSPASFRKYATPAAIKSHIKQVFQEHIMFSVLPDGALGDMQRRTDALPDLGLGYVGAVVGNFVAIADLFARINDFSLLTYNTAAGTCGSEGTINDGGSRVGENKDLLFEMQAYLNYFADDYARYHPTNDSPTDDNRLDGRNPRDGSAWGTIRDTWVAAVNMYYRNTDLQSGYKRTRSGTVAYPSGGTLNSGDTYEGPGQAFAGQLLQFGDLEGNLYPYEAKGLRKFW